ncbi:N-acetyltransferase [Maribellus sp. CM-23]|uniref:arsinothricin resistance N-acetyltransferase ArsN1 family B n=1 Tax=Maribellus sp. CM-23 TaxID=2781026 RepID=UPI001F180903|nr:arsinothricin resistance N-acetyltransferase ArsN1 family B [Maribellus sp. CM-23]MCE4564826.1 N-acetyltransferase [Maribellus sp. CM-23]
MIRDIRINDSKALAAIYNYYISHTCITFEEIPVTENDIKERIRSHNLNLPWIVYEEDGEIVGYAYATEWKSRSAYKFSVESTVYLKQGSQGKGIGTILYRELLNRIAKSNIHAVIGGIALPNNPSVALHEKLGFEKVAQFKEVGFKFGKWIDVGYWELVLSK